MYMMLLFERRRNNESGEPQRGHHMDDRTAVLLNEMTRLTSEPMVIDPKWRSGSILG